MAINLLNCYIYCRKKLGCYITAATTWSNHRKQCATTRNIGSISRMSYHRVPHNYPEKNKRVRIPRSTWRKARNSITHKTMLHAKDKYRRSPWVSKGSLRIESCDSKISYANIRWDYWDLTSSFLDMNIMLYIESIEKEIHNVHNLHAIYDYQYQKPCITMCI